MHIVRDGVDRVVIAGRGQLRVEAVVGTALFVLALVPLLGLRRFSAVAIGGGLLAAAGLILLYAGFRAGPRLELLVKDRTLDTGSDKLSLEAASVLVLGGEVTSEDGYVRARYRTSVAFEDGRSVPLLEWSEPERVLSDTEKLARRLSLPVRAGWGLPPDAVVGGRRPSGGLPDAVVCGIRSPGASAVGQSPRRGAAANGTVGGSPAPGAPPVIECDSAPIEPVARRASAFALVIGGAALGVALAILVSPTLRLGRPAVGLSLTLPVSATLLILLIGLAIGTRRVRVRRGNVLCVEDRVLGIAWRSRSVAWTSVRGAWAVSPDGGDPLHVVVATESGPFSLPCAGAAAQKLAQALTPLGSGLNFRPEDRPAHT